MFLKKAPPSSLGLANGATSSADSIPRPLCIFLGQAL